MRLKTLSALCLASALAGTAFAGQPEPVALTPIEHALAQLEVVGMDGHSRVYKPEDLETMTTYRLRTTTPWRTEPAEFEGVLLSDLLAANGLADAPAIRVYAENDFSSVIERDVWTSIPVLVATRVDGHAHSRRVRGPIQFVMDMDAYQASDVASESDLVWMAARIEPEM